jgi:hypothetical protein
MVDKNANSARTMGFMVLDPLGSNDDLGFHIDVAPEKGQDYQAVRIIGKDTL